MAAGMVLAAVGIAFAAIGVVAGAGKLPLNPFVGIRLPRLMASEANWDRGHRAAAPLLVVGGVGTVAGGVLTALTRSEGAILATIGWLVVAVAVATVVSIRAMAR